MDKKIVLLCTLLLSGILLSCGCLGERAQAATSVKYVCSDGSVVSESRECRVTEKACVCDQCPETKESTVEKQTKISLITENSTNAKAIENESEGPCVSMGCPADARFVGNSETKKFHECDCAQAAKLSPKKRVCFMSAKYAESLGYVPCGFCKPSDTQA